MQFLNLIRYQNIFALALTQALIYFSVIIPTIKSYAVNSYLPSWMIWSLIISSCLIAAGGYVINDYFDIKIDRINKPQKMIITNGIEKPTAMKIYQMLTALGIIAGLIVAWQLSSVTIAFIILVTPGMLWFYSASYKRQFIIGNLIVAVAAALSVLLPLIAQSALLNATYGELLGHTPVLKQLYTLVCGFAIFAFLFTTIREIIKDLEDEPGDREMECKTLPIIWGTLWAKITISSLTILTVAALFFCAQYFLSFSMESNISLRYLAFAVGIPSLCMLSILWSKSCTSYRNAQNMVKFIMILGILYSILYQFIIAKTHDITFFGIFNIA